MALISRLSRLFQADFHAVLDRIEEPDLQLRQAVREMQLALDRDRQRHDLLQHELEQHAAAQARIETDLGNFDEELDICLASAKDDLARDLIRRKLGAEKQRHGIQAQAETTAKLCQQLQAQIDEQVQQLDSMKQKLELLVGDENYPRSSYAAADTVRGEEVEIALLREKERRAKR